MIPRLRKRPTSRFAGWVAAVTLAAVVPACAGAPKPADAARPRALAAWADPATGARVTRISGDPGTRFPLAGGKHGTWGGVSRHHYSRDQPWSADGALIALENRDGGSPALLLLDGTTYAPVRGRCEGYVLEDFRWHPRREHARIMIGVRKDSLVWFDPVACKVERGWKLPFRPRLVGLGEGNPSDDGRFLALANRESIVVIDMDPQPPLAPYSEGNRRLGPVAVVEACSLFAGDPGRCPIGNVSISPSGKYVDLKFAGQASTSTSDAHRIYAVDPRTLAIRPHAMAAGSERCGEFAGRPNGWIFPLKHADLARNPFDGDEDVAIGVRSCPGSKLGRVVMVRMRDGQVTALTDPRGEPSAAHVSTRNLDRPGWAYVTYYSVQGRRASGEIVAVKLDGSRSVERFTRHRSQWKGCYRCEAHAVPSRDGRRVMFASNWNEDCPGCPPGQVSAFVAELAGAP